MTVWPATAAMLANGFHMAGAVAAPSAGDIRAFLSARLGAQSTGRAIRPYAGNGLDDPIAVASPTPRSPVRTCLWTQGL